MMIRVGDTAEFTKTISESDIYLFAGISGDFNPAHINNVMANKSQFKGRIAHGFLAGSLISAVLGTKLPGPGTVYLEQNMKFKSPVYIGDTLSARVIVSEIINSKKGIIRLSTDIINQNGDIVIDGYAVVKTADKVEEKNVCDEHNTKVAKTAIIHDGVKIGNNVVIHDYVVVYPNTIIGDGTEVYEHCVLGKKPTSPGNTSRQLRTDYEPLEIGKDCIICPSSVVYCGTKIGDNVLLGDFCSIREDCIVGNNCLISRNVSVNYNTTIGDFTKIMDNSHITGNMKIGNHVFISVLVATTNDNTMGREEYSEDHVQGAIIEDYVTVGAAANILPQVTIGKNSIIGAGAVVTKDVPESKVVMGVPAKIIRNV